MSTLLAHAALVLFIVKATVLLIGALVATRAMQRASAGSRHLVWLVALGTLLIVPALTIWGPIRLDILPAAPMSALYRALPPVPPAPSASPGSPAEPITDAGALPVTSAPAMHVTSPAGIDARTSTVKMRARTVGATTNRFGLDALSGVMLGAMIWAVVALATVAVLVRDALVAQRILRAGVPLDTPEWRGMLWEIADRLGLADAPRLLRSGDTRMPFACGVLRATVVLPTECERWSLARRRAVLLHELAHVRRHDLLGHMVGRLACAVYWFHPLVWTAAKRLRTESERACDDLALSCGTQASDYAEHLLDIVTSARRARTPTVALAMARRKEFEGRMLAILDPDVRRAGPKPRQAGALVAGLVTVAMFVGAATPVSHPARVTPDGDAVLEHQPLDQQPLAGGALIMPFGPSVSVTTAAPQIATTQIATAQSAATPRVGSSPMGDIVGYVAGNATSDATRAQVTLDSVVMASTEAGTEASTRMRAGIQAVSSAASQGVSHSVDAMLAQRRVLSGSGDRVGSPEERAALLVRILGADSSASVRRIAAQGLAQLAKFSTVADALAAALRHDRDAGVRENAAWGLAQSVRGSTVARDALVDAVQHDPSTRVRSQAAWALGSVGTRAAAPALVVALRDSSESVRSNAAWAVGAIAPRPAPQGVTDALLEGLRDPGARVRANVAWALFTIRDPRTAPALNAAFQRETDGRVQITILEALGTMGAAGLPSIRVALNSNNERVRAAAVSALSMWRGWQGTWELKPNMRSNMGANPEPTPTPIQ